MTAKLVAIDGESRTPPYEQVRAQIAAQIADGTLVDGHRLPSVRDLATAVGLAPGTVAKAYALLEESGLVRTARGAGTRVIRPATPPGEVLDAAKALASTARAAGLSADQAAAVLRHEWEG